ncbi:MAG: hypothetical protein ACKO2D_08250, partial [Chloroflexota bacterium]
RAGCWFPLGAGGRASANTTPSIGIGAASADPPEAVDISAMAIAVTAAFGVMHPSRPRTMVVTQAVTESGRVSRALMMPNRRGFRRPGVTRMSALVRRPWVMIDG